MPKPGLFEELTRLPATKQFEVGLTYMNEVLRLLTTDMLRTIRDRLFEMHSGTMEEQGLILLWESGRVEESRNFSLKRSLRNNDCQRIAREADFRLSARIANVTAPR